jgi:hypothetical protein
MSPLFATGVFEMNGFFAFNLFVSLLLTNGITFIFIRAWDPADYIVNIIIVAIVLAYTWLRGRHSLIVKNDSLIVNNYPFWRKIKCADITNVEIKRKLVVVKRHAQADLNIHFSYGPQSAIHLNAEKFIDIEMASASQSR